MTKILQKRVGNSIRFYREGGFGEEVACLIDGRDHIIFDPMADYTALLGEGDVVDQTYFDRIGLTVTTARQIDAMRTPDLRPESAPNWEG